MRRLVTSLGMAAALLASGNYAHAQQDFEMLKKGIQPEKLYHFHDFDSVNVMNGNMTIAMPIGLTYPLNGGVTYNLVLSYNSNVWDYLPGAAGTTRSVPAIRSNAGMGWVIGMGRYIDHRDPSNLSLSDLYEAPDGGDHKLDGGCVDPACTVYNSTDGSELRARVISATIQEIDSPDGITRRFEQNSDQKTWRLTRIFGHRGSDQVTVTTTAGSSSQCPGAVSFWTIADSIGRMHYVCFKNYAVDGQNRPMLDQVVMQSAQGSTATYRFAYTEQPNCNTLDGNTWQYCIAKSPLDTDWDSGESPQVHTAPFLSTITFPDNSTYRMSYNLSGFGTGALASVTLPTLGTISYAYTVWTMPSVEICAAPNGIGGGSVGINSRTLTPLLPSGQAGQPETWGYTTELMPAGWSKTNCPPVPPEVLAGPVRMWEEMVVTVGDPTGSYVKNHFTVLPADDSNTSPDGLFKRENRFLPYGAYDSTQNRYLSQEVYDCSTSPCTLARKIYVREEYDGPPRTDCCTDEPPPNLRLASQRTFFMDDCASSVCNWTGVDNSDWDGYGHYRVATTSASFGNGGDSRTVTTAWNKSGGSPRTIQPTDNWLPNTYESVTTQENGATQVEQDCFDLSTGVLRAKRTLSGTSPSSTDLLAVFGSDQPNGNLVSEKFYGGDSGGGIPGGANISPLCSALQTTFGAPPYEVDHTWQNGMMKTSQYAGATFLSRDLDIDASGLIVKSRDTAGVATAYNYDAMGRLTSVVPPTSVASTTYAYANATALNLTLTQPFTVTQTTSGSAGTVTKRYQLDSFGRLWRETQNMPDGSSTSVRETLYDAKWRKASVSEWATLPSSNELTFVPPYKTTYAYDGLDKQKAVTAPDQSVIRFAYSGAHSMSRTVGISTVAGQADTAVTTTETYDGQGRLASVAGADGTTAAYSYDAGNRLAAVKMSATTTAAVQNRIFDYDGRGLLRWESQPESGMASYTYDARGHVLTKRQSAASSQFDLNYTYDSAERLLTVFARNPFYDPSNPSQPQFRSLKEFTYGDDNGTFVKNSAGGSVTINDLKRGKEVTATRHNYGQTAQEPIYDIQDLYHYGDAAGHKTDRTTTITKYWLGSQMGSLPISMSVAYNDLNLPTTMSYPMCDGCGAPDTDPDRSAVTRTYNAGRLTALSNFASNISYWPNGMRNVLSHANGIDDTQSVTNMPRPSQIGFATATHPYDNCVRPSIDPATPAITSTSGASSTLGVTVTGGTGPFTYTWTASTSNATSTIATHANVSSTTDSVTVTPTATTMYSVTVANACGFEYSNYLNIGQNSCPTPNSQVEAVHQPDGSWTLRAYQIVAGQSRSWTWVRLSDNVTLLGSATSSDPTLNLGTVSTTTTYRFTVTDSCGSGTRDVTVTVPLPITTGLQAVVNTTYTKVKLTWPAINGAALYTIYRRSLGGTWEQAGTSTTASFIDTNNVASSRTYVYRVTSDNGGQTDYDVATTSALTAAVAGQVITATPMNSMLDAVNSVRAAAGWPGVSWSSILAANDPLPQPGQLITARQLIACRERIDEALQALGVGVRPYTDGDVVHLSIRALYINEVEQRAQRTPQVF